MTAPNEAENEDIATPVLANAQLAAENARLTSKLAEMEVEMARREQSHATLYTIASQRGNRYADENEKLRQELEKMRGEG